MAKTRTVRAAIACLAVVAVSSCSDSGSGGSAGSRTPDLKGFCAEVISVATKAGVMDAKQFNQSALSDHVKAKAFFTALAKDRDTLVALAPAEIKKEVAGDLDFIKARLNGADQSIITSTPNGASVAQFESSKCHIGGFG